MAPAGSSHLAPLRAEGAPEASLGGLCLYLDLLAEWSLRVNLTGARTADERAQVLVRPALALLPWLRPGALLDIGSGNGSPGLVLALLQPDRPATLLEPRTRRWAFLREAARRTGRPDVVVLRLRHDAYRGGPAPNVTVRGLRLPMQELAALVAEGGRLLCLGSPPPRGGTGPLLPVSGVPIGIRAYERAGPGVSRDT